MREKTGIIGLVGGLSLALAIAILLIALPIQLRADAPSGDVDKGKEIFNSKCTICHTIGGGKKIGPDLKGVTQRRPEEWLVKFISDPDKMFSENDPTATGLLKECNGVRMPNQGLTKEQVTDVIAYLKSQEEPAKSEKDKQKAE
jgi:cytochrome c2